jgi:hypothetical protein
MRGYVPAMVDDVRMSWFCMRGLALPPLGVIGVFFW